MPELLIDFITSLDGYGAADGWPGWWGLEGPEYLAWLGEQPEAAYTVLLGATTYRVMSGYAAEGEPGTEALAGMTKVVFSSTLREPLAWANTQLVADDPVEAVREMKDTGAASMRTMGSLTLCRSLLRAGLVDRFRVVVFPRHHRKHRPGPHLRRLSRRRPRDAQQPHLRRPHPAARVRPHRARWSSRIADDRRATRLADGARG
jgi:dihydrofolate reductase